MEKAAALDRFGLNKVANFEIEDSAEEFEAMQPPAGVPGGPPPATRPSQPERGRNLFGVEILRTLESVTTGGTAYKGVGRRYSGNASYMASAAGLNRFAGLRAHSRSCTARISRNLGGRSRPRCPEESPRI